MKFKPIKKIIRNNLFLILVAALFVSCDSGGDSDNNDTQNSGPSAPTMAPSPTSQPAPSPSTPTAQPTQPPVVPTPVPTQAPAAPTSTPAIPTPAPTASPTPLPTRTPEPGNQPLNDFQSTVLDLVNQARAQARNCGSDFFPVAPSVTWDFRIESAALAHSIDMAENQNFSHTGTDGSSAGDRLLMQGYEWRTWGENILVGLDDARGAMDAWIGSTGHCSIIMNPSLREIGAGVAEGIYQGFRSSYWTLLFATEN